MKVLSDFLPTLPKESAHCAMSIFHFLSQVLKCNYYLSLMKSCMIFMTLLFPLACFTHPTLDEAVSMITFSTVYRVGKYYQVLHEFRSFSSSEHKN